MTPPAIIQPANAVDTARLIKCIMACERGRWSDALGKKGERGPLQFKEDTWKEMTSLPFFYADDEDWALEVGRFALNKYRYQLLERHIEPTTYRLALAFHCGLNAVILSKWVSAADSNYAYRIVNLMNDQSFKP